MKGRMQMTNLFYWGALTEYFSHKGNFFGSTLEEALIDTIVGNNLTVEEFNTAIKLIKYQFKKEQGFDVDDVDVIDDIDIIKIYESLVNEFNIIEYRVNKETDCYVFTVEIEGKTMLKKENDINKKKDKALNESIKKYDEWINSTGIFSKFNSYYGEMKGLIIDTVNRCFESEEINEEGINRIVTTEFIRFHFDDGRTYDVEVKEAQLKTEELMYTLQKYMDKKVSCLFYDKGKVVLIDFSKVSLLEIHSEK